MVHVKTGRSWKRKIPTVRIDEPTRNTPPVYYALPVGTGHLFPTKYYRAMGGLAIWGALQDKRSMWHRWRQNLRRSPFWLFLPQVWRFAAAESNSTRARALVFPSVAIPGHANLGLKSN